MYILRRNVQKLKRCIFLNFMTIFYNFAIKLEPSWTKRVVQLISETKKASDVSLFILG